MRANCDGKLLLLNDEALAEVDCFAYLGSVMSNAGDCSIDVKNRPGKAWGAFKKLLRSNGINTNKCEFSTAMLYPCFFNALKHGNNQTN